VIMIAVCLRFFNAGGLSVVAQIPGTWNEWLALFGRFHVVVIHFPIALLLMAAAGEIWRLFRKPAPWIAATLYAGSAGAIAAAALGWLRVLAGGYDGGGDTLLIHQWLGTAGAAFAIAAAGLRFSAANHARLRGWATGALLLAAIIVGAAGHFGGTLVHGNLLTGG
jgi:hypothetical protein